MSGLMLMMLVYLPETQSRLDLLLTRATHMSVDSTFEQAGKATDRQRQAGWCRSQSDEARGTKTMLLIPVSRKTGPGSEKRVARSKKQEAKE